MSDDEAGGPGLDSDETRCVQTTRKSAVILAEATVSCARLSTAEDSATTRMISKARDRQCI